MRLPIDAAFAASLCPPPAFGDDVPFAAEPWAATPPGGAYKPSLGEIMQLIQLKHVKPWQAGSAYDWQLAAFESEQIRDTFYKAAMTYGNIPVEDVLAVDRPLTEIDQAIKTRDSAGFSVAYGSLTKACNGCHQAANVGFIVIKTPDATRRGDQTL